MRTSPKIESLKQTSNANPKSTFESGANELKPAKPSRNRVPPPQRERILQKHVAGKSITEISREEKRNRETVGKIVRGHEMQEYVRTMRERFFGLGQDAISAIRYSLTEQNDGRLGFQLLASIGVVPTQEERQLLTAPGPEPESDEEELHKRIMSGLIRMTIERANHFGYRVPHIEEDVKQLGGRINYETAKFEPLLGKTATKKARPGKKTSAVRDGAPDKEQESPF